MPSNINSKIIKNFPLAPLTTFGIGGPAKFFIEIKTKADLLGACGWAEKNQEPIFIIGGGSNVLINDQGVAGLVIRLLNNEIKIQKELVTAGAGVMLAQLLKLTAEKGLTGLEWSAGIPRATVGGAVFGNASAFGERTGDLVKEVEAYDLKKNLFVKLKKKDCCFEYRESLFKSNPKYVIWKTVMEFKKSERAAIEEKIKSNLAFRKKTPREPNAGSVFKNLTLEEIKNAKPELMVRLKELGCPENGKAGAAVIIDKILDLKGKTIGGAKISTEHGNFIINTGGAAAGDVAALVSYIKTQARNRLGLRLEEEIQYLGF